jgi:hypothetical protein
MSVSAASHDYPDRLFKACGLNPELPLVALDVLDRGLLGNLPALGPIPTHMSDMLMWVGSILLVDALDFAGLGSGRGLDRRRELRIYGAVPLVVAPLARPLG